VRVEIREEAFEPYAEVLRYQASRPELKGHYGATAVFVGTMRQFCGDESIRRMRLEYYPGMTERQLEAIMDTARIRHGFLDALIVHRVGMLYPEDPIVLAAVWASHRGMAFDACREIVEELKSRAPFWKQESLAEEDRWVEKNTQGYGPA
jgi:molybdopterin synthase catalytic subunit